MSDTLTRTPAAGSPDIIEPRWWNGAPALDPASYQVDRTAFAMDAADLDPNGPLALRMRETFRDVGLVHLVNTGLTEHADMRAFAKLVVDAEMPYEGGANPRGALEPNVYEIGAPLSAWLHYHHEMAYVGTSTRMIAFLCKRELPGRGATFVSDNVRATEALSATDFGRKLARLGGCYRRDRRSRRGRAARPPAGPRDVVGTRSAAPHALLRLGVRVLRPARPEPAVQQRRRPRHVVRHLAARRATRTRSAPTLDDVWRRHRLHP